MGSYIKEHLNDGEGDGTELPLHTAVQKLRDEVTALTMLRFRGNNRNLSMLIAKLDEARHWAVAYKLETRELQLIDRGEVLREVTEATQKTEMGTGY